VPVTIGEIEVYYLLDRMSVGQTFVNDVADGNKIAQMEVWGKTLAGDMVYIPRYNGTVENYRVVSSEEMENVTNSSDFSDFYGNSMTMRDADQPEAYAHENAFAVLFNTQSLSEDRNYDGTTKRMPLYSEVYVTYNLILNEKALVGDPGNVNDVALVLSHRITDNQTDISNEVHVPEQDVFEPFVDPEQLDLDVINPQCIDTRVYTYAMQVTKIGEGTENMEDVTFELRDSRGNVIPVSQYTEADRGNLAVDDCTARVGDYYVDKDTENPATITIDADQEVYIYGLETGTYQLVETKTLNGYQLLKEPIVLTVVSDSAAEAQPMSYQSDTEGDYFIIESGKGYYIWQDGMKLKIDVTGHEVGEYVAVSGEVYSYDISGDDGSMSQNEAAVTKRYSYRWTDSETLTFGSNYGMEDAVSAADGIFDAAKGMYNDGLFAFTVLNRHGFNIPSTGGIGTTIFAAIGSGVAGMGVLGMMLSKKRKQDEEA
ncbi:MAG: LPXTG cell wall anchor domain-containing protein, partial [Firmicutes bacterium]|nr:LPXTG cell wall anchor domain-containing protein [Bacillota bacterium]